MIVSVAAAESRSVRAVAAESYALTLWTFLQLRDRDRLRRASARFDRLDAADLLALAFHDPKLIAQERRTYVGSLGPRASDTSVERPAGRSVDEWFAIAEHFSATRRPPEPVS